VLSALARRGSCWPAQAALSRAPGPGSGALPAWLLPRLLLLQLPGASSALALADAISSCMTSAALRSCGPALLLLLLLLLPPLPPLSYDASLLGASACCGRCPAAAGPCSCTESISCDCTSHASRSVTLRPRLWTSCRRLLLPAGAWAARLEQLPASETTDAEQLLLGARSSTPPPAPLPPACGRGSAASSGRAGVVLPALTQRC
jgi:hypothetical protein